MYSPTAVVHFYTTDEAQRNNTINNLGFNDEGIAGVPFYRMYQLTTHDHFYTTNKAERNNAIKSGGYQEEHIAGYVLPI
ncbi:hypothetical protein EDD85DRAFT_962016 [Armillaria nabsnona]|nr:hypothetical protein EDD85DRAFT_962016 [Armillaria nabsnona]